ncbi:unnamed protein product [Brassica oleracea var. botrytis]
MMIIKERRGNRLKKPPNPLSPNSRKPYHQRPSSDRRLIDAGGVDMHEALSCRLL